MIVSLALSGALAAPHHTLTAEVQPAAGTLRVVDRIEGLAPGATFLLHAGLQPEVRTKGWKLERIDAVEGVASEERQTARNTEGPVPLERYRLVTKKKKPRYPVEIAYGGPIVHPLATQGEEYQRSFSETPGTIQADGVFLARSSYWIPDTDEPITFSLTTTLPEGWSAVSSGNPTSTGWASSEPMDEVYLVAAAFQRTSTEAPLGDHSVGIDVYLREADPGLTFRYQAATARYLTLYEGMLTPYPFERFALVENFWETGYGMPGFTLLGPEVIRFPWVLTSSYPHEILHSWWGNSATIDPAGGNWSEGLTAYMADHLFATHRGQDRLYRRSTLKKFTDLAAGNDFPLVEFLGRTSAATEAVGYGKSLMFWHMVRRRVGDEAFLAGLRDFHAAYRFRPAGFADLEPFLSKASGQDLAPFFRAWTTQTGAIELAVEDVRFDGQTVHATLVQAEPYEPAAIPIRVTTASGRHAFEADVELLPQGRTPVTLTVPADLGEPLRLDVDPDFDVMRVLDPMEVPPALTSLFGEDEKVFVLPAGANPEEVDAWKALAAGWARPSEPRFLLDSEVDAPPDGAWVLGWSNRHGPAVAGRVADHGAAFGPKGLTWEGETFGRDSAIVLVARATDPDRANGWVTAGNVPSIAGLARKLPHYTKYSLLAFSGEAPDNTAKATWEAVGSPLSFQKDTAKPVPAKAGPPRPALAEMPPRFHAEPLLAEASWIADPARGGRGLGSPGLAEATDHVVAKVEAMGVPVERQTWKATVGTKEVELTNVVASLPGSGRPMAPVVVMAHLDHLGTGGPDVRKGNEGKLHPGADDNASGVAVALALLEQLAAEPPRPRPVTFVFTTGEESGLLGARHWLSTVDAPFTCVALDTVGRLAESGKITVAGAETARELRFVFMGVGYTTGATFAFAQPGLDGSDHAACKAVGTPAVQLTTGAHSDYHAPGDTPDKLDGDGLVTVADAALEAVAYLAERTDPLTVTLGDSAPASTGARRASLGTMPEFTFPGPGVMVADVMPESAALAAGIAAGDVLLAIDGATLPDLRTFSELLKQKSPGDRVSVRYRRGSEEKTVEVVL
ncbi:MAG: M20/M25/M40 family metallo-hydrolase, partial [Myxococcales bacterium]|nr:M20/M25/M40 family metallo-hydrolase [Myxococcales bacterium]